MAVQISAHAHANGEEFPFVTIEDFEAIGQSIRSQSGVEALIFAPIVYSSKMPQYEEYVAQNDHWVEESRFVALQAAANNGLLSDESSAYSNSTTLIPVVYDSSTVDVYGVSISSAADGGIGPYAPIWQVSPPPFNKDTINNNMLNHDFTRDTLHSSLFTQDLLFTNVTNYRLSRDTVLTYKDHELYHKSIMNYTVNNDADAYDRPHSIVVQPIYKTVNDDSSPPVAFVIAFLPWDWYLINLLPEGAKGVACVLRNTCGQSFTYELNGNTAHYMGEGDKHDRRYSHTEVVIEFYDLKHPSLTRSLPGHCLYSFHVYATATLHDQSTSLLPTTMTFVFASTFLIILLVPFAAFIVCVRRRNDRVTYAAARSDAIVSSLFPSSIRDRLYEEGENDTTRTFLGNTNSKSKLRRFMTEESRSPIKETEYWSEEVDGLNIYNSKPIADLFVDTSVLFADIAGFTAWSSTREPSQVFLLLETLYISFDEIASRYRVYKIETVGDCYVAVAGIPDAIKDHAVVMARFARDCRARMLELVKRMEVMLGPETAELAMRFVGARIHLIHCIVRSCQGLLSLFFLDGFVRAFIQDQ
jgi:Adenylate and Guanylate cyclase catalytic domain